jgi:hypothetical protein
VVLEPVPEREWPAGYWESVDAAREDLALGRILPLGGQLLDLGEDET